MISLFLNHTDHFQKKFYCYLTLITLFKTEILYQVDPGFICKYVGSFILGEEVGDDGTFPVSIINFLKTQNIYYFLFFYN